MTEGPRQDSPLIESLQSGLRRQAQPEKGSSIGMREG